MKKKNSSLKTNFEKALSILLSVLMLFTLLPATAYAAASPVVEESSITQGGTDAENGSGSSASAAGDSASDSAAAAATAGDSASDNAAAAAAAGDSASDNAAAVTEDSASDNAAASAVTEGSATDDAAAQAAAGAENETPENALVGASDAASYIFDVGEGNVTISMGRASGYLTVTYGAAQTVTEQFQNTQQITLTGGSSTAAVSNTVTVKSGVTANITTDGLYIDVSATAKACPFMIEAGATVNLTLKNENSFKSGGNAAALCVPGDGTNNAALNITKESNGGSLTAAAGSSSSSSGGAGIGGGAADVGGGVITISGGSITAQGASGSGAAGIGGGSGGSGGTITVNGGNVTASGGSGGAGAGIGGGDGAEGGTIIISGGTVTATGGTAEADYAGSGIGIGYGGSAAYVTISGGTVTAKGGSDITTGTSRCYGISVGSENGGSFSTGDNGHAVITADSIDDTSGKTGWTWSGLIIIDKTGGLYGTAAPTEDFSIPAGTTVGIGYGAAAQTLTVSPGITMTNEGTLNVNNTDSLVISGRLVNNGTINVKDGGTVTNNGDVSGSGSLTGTGVTKETLAALTAPVVIAHTKTSVCLKNNITSGGLKYGYTEGSGKTSADAAGWQDSPVFTGLTGNTEYTFYVKYTGSPDFYTYSGSDAKDKPSAGTAVMTDGAAFDAGYGSVTVKVSPESTDKIYVVYGNILTTEAFANTEKITLTGGSGSAPVTDNTVTVESGATANITTDGLYIDTSATSGSCAFMIRNGAVVNLTLKNENTFKSGEKAAGIGVPEDAALTVTKESNGSVAATGVFYGAGIGGGNGAGGGVVTVSGGNVTAAGGTYAAGIGGGNGASGGTVTVNGGNVTATGGSDGAGIGGGHGGSGGTAKLSGGNVTATGKDIGAGIGGGMNGSGDMVEISGGSVAASGGEWGSGIGGGGNGSGGTIEISGGSVTAGSSAGAGIGGGDGGSGGKVTVSGGIVTAVSDAGAGIGRGRSNNQATVTGGTFSTGENGCAVIAASSISDQTGKTSTASPWSGLIIEGTTGALYGTSVTPTADFTVPAGDTVSLGNDDAATQTLTVASGITMTNNGTINIKKGDTLVIDGTLVNNGTITIEDGGTLVNNGGITNNSGAAITNKGDVSGSGTVTNNGTITPKKLPDLTAPTVTLCTSDTVTLKDELPAFTYFRYAKGDTTSAAYSEWQKSPSFTGLTADTVYTFYAKYDTGESSFYSFTGTSSGTTVRTRRADASAGYTFDVSKGAVTVKKSLQGGNLIYVVCGDTETEDFDYTTQAVTLTGGTKAAPTANTVTVENGVTANITTDGLYIDASATSDSCAFVIQSGAAVNLTLKNENTFTSGYNTAGIGVPEGAELTVTEESGGSVTAAGGENGGAGIGGGISVNGGTVTVNGGTVTATSNGNGAGIGGGDQGSGGKITVSGGTVTATSRNCGAGIGGGYKGNGGTVTVNGGTVTAVGFVGAGIGGGYGAGGGKITVNGGTVNATGTSGGAGIGGGYQGNGGMVTVKGGMVTATGGSPGGAGIGNGDGGSGCEFYTDGKNGKAVILASSISDQSGKTSTTSPWSGLIIEGTTGALYGTSVTPTENFSIPSGVTVTLGNDDTAAQTLTVASGITMTNSGSITVKNGDSLVIDGTLVNNGTITYEDGGTVTLNGNEGGTGTLTGTGSGLTKKALPALTAPVVIAHTKTSVALKEVTDGAPQYGYTEGSGAAPTEINNWQDSPVFTGLTENTDYTFYIKYTVSGDYYAYSGTDKKDAPSDGTEVTTDGASFDAGYGSVTVKASPADADKIYVVYGNILTTEAFANTENITLTGGSGSAPVTANTVTVENGATANITTDGLYIDASATEDVYAFMIQSGAAVNLTLKNENSFMSGIWAAGIGVPEGAALTVTKESDGSVTATGLHGAGIGGGYEGSGGTVTVNGGTVTARSATGSAGIGGGDQGSGGTVTVSGGTVTATGKYGGAGIGGGDLGSGGTVTVSGGTVTATGGSTGGAGIGGGWDGNGGTVTVSGGTVTATGGGSGAGIGGGRYGSGGTVTVSGGTVTAIGSYGGAGIGGGDGGSGGTFSTDENGNAVILASSISDQSGKTSTASPWSGLIIEGTTGALYGTSVTPTADFTVPAGDTVTLGNDDTAAQTLTVASGITMTNNGNITVKKGDSLVVDGTLVNNGTITYEDGGTVTLNGNVGGTGTLTGTGSGLMKKALPALTAPVVLTHTKTSVALKEVTAGVPKYGYTTGSGKSPADVDNWQDSPVFTGLTENTDYTFYVKYTGSEDYYAYSDTVKKDTPSAGTEVTTDGFAFNASGGSVIVRPDLTDAGKIYVVYGDILTTEPFAKTENITLSGGTKDFPTSNAVTVENGVTANITTDGLYIDMSVASNSCVFMIRSGAAVNLTLKNENTFASGDRAAGIGVPEGAALTVTKESDGSVTAAGGANAAGIGGGYGESGGAVTVNGGTVKAFSASGAGIGGGDNGSGGTVTVSGGNVTATSLMKAGIDGTFSTGENGNAVIAASSISDQSGKASTSTTPWSGLIIEGTTGALYGTSVTPTADFTVPKGDTVTLGNSDTAAQTLTVASGITMTNNGTINIKKGDTLVIDGALVNNGTITIEDGGTLVNNGVITNNSGAVITNNGDVSGSGAVTDNGTITPKTLPDLTAPTVTLCTSDTVTLKDELPAYTSFRYAKGDASSAAYSEWQKSPSFTGLTADTVYTFYAKYDVAGLPFYSYAEAGSGTAVRTRLSQDAGYTFDVSKGSVTVKKSPQGGNLIYVVCGDSQTEDFDYTKQAVTLIGGTKAAPTANTVTVENGVTANITTDGLYIDTSATINSCAFMIQSGAAVNLTLKNENTFKSGNHAAGIGVPEGAVLTVTEESDGSVTAAGGLYSAGIGGIDSISGGTVTVNGGTMTAAGGSGGAGIGGGKAGSGGAVTVNGGNLTVTGGIGSAGIGSGVVTDTDTVNVSGGTVTVNGGNIIATGGYFGAGIGCGQGGIGGTITVNSGTVTASGGNSGAGVGGGLNGSCGTVTVNGGNVTATGGNQASGIGNGDVASSGSAAVTVNGGNVNAIGGLHGAGIGDGANGSGATFSTGENGNAVIVASSISDQSGKASTGTTPWSGLIIEGTTGALYGTSVTPTADFTVPAGDTVTLGNDDTAAQTLTVASGITMTNNGDITVKKGDSLVIDGTLVNNGTITIEDGAALVNSGTTTIEDGATLINNGGITNNSGATITNNGDVSGNGTVTNDGTIKPRTLEDSAVPAAPTAEEITSVSVTLKDELPAVTSFRYAKGDASSVTYSNWQRNPSFTGLSPDTVYTFYAKYDTGESPFYSYTGTAESSGTAVRTRLGKDAGGYIFDVSKGAVTVKKSPQGGNLIYVVCGDSQTEDFDYTEQAITLTGGTKDVPTANTVTVESGVTANITTDGLYIDTSATEKACAFMIQSGAAVNLTLKNENTFKSGSGVAGIGVPEGAELTVTEESDGSVTAAGGSKGAGIGGGQSGGGQSGSGQSGSGGKITVNGGTVTANGKGAGIGGGYGGSGGTVTVSGGTVTANGDSAGIGGGYGGSGGTVTVSGGTVTANGYDAGIGGGYGGSGGTVTVNGGTVTATSVGNGAGIGGGDQGNGGTVTVSGGTVTATGGLNGGAGIGGGYIGGGGTVTVSGGTLTANGGSDNGAGIGGGYKGSGGTVTVSGGIVTATGGDLGAGIGGGLWSGSNGTFSTGDSGNAVIVASSISDQSGKASTGTTPWSGLIIEGTAGALYGASVTLTADFTVPAGDTVTLGNDDTAVQTLTVASGITMTNNGDITVKKGDSLVIDGTLVNNGTITIEDGATLVNSGTTTIEDGATLVNNGGITNNSGAVITNNGDVSGSGTVTNNGTINPRTLAPAAPMAEEITSVSVTLKNELPATASFRYAKGDASSTAYSDWQKSPSFTGLSPDTVYTFYAKYDAMVSPFYSYAGTSSGTAVRTRLGKEAGGYMFDVSKGAVTVKKSPQGGNLIYVVCGDNETEDFDYTEQAITLTGGTKDAPTANTVTVESGVTANITTDGLYIDASATENACAFMLQSGAAVDLTLKNENTFKSGNNAAGIGVPEGAELTVTEESDGSVTAAGGDYGAGIGGEFNGSGGKITVNGGTVTATGGDYGAGIGGGFNGSDGKITVNGGTVTATGGVEGAGIGGGYGSSGGTVIVSGGTVTATGGNLGTGIGGGGDGGNGGTVTVSGGTVRATGGNLGAGIGGGQRGSGGTVTVSGGTVTATGGDLGAGIGGGISAGISGGSGGTVTVSGGTVTAVGGSDGAGIGGGSDGNGGTVTVSGGTVTATGGEKGAGIGGGNGGNGGTVTVNGGIVMATGGDYGAGIGGGLNGSDGKITVNGGTVTAVGGSDGAGIGDGSNGSGVTFSTGDSGNAVILASSISDRSGKTNGTWSGLILEKNSAGNYEGSVYGTTVTPTENFEIPSGAAATILAGKTLALADGITMGLSGTLTDLGTLKVGDKGVLDINGTAGTLTVGDTAGGSGAAGTLENRGAVNVKNGGSLIVAAAGNAANLAKTGSGTGSTDSGTGSGTGTSASGTKGTLTIEDGGTVVKRDQAAPVLNAADIAADNTTVTLKAVPDDISHGSTKYGCAASSGADAGAVTWTADGSNVITGLTAPQACYFYEMYDATDYYNASPAGAGTLSPDGAQQGTVTVHVTAAGGTAAGVNGVRVELRKASDGSLAAEGTTADGTLAGTGTTAGVVCFTGLAWGGYYLALAAVPGGYEADSSHYSVAVSAETPEQGQEIALAEKAADLIEAGGIYVFRSAADTEKVLDIAAASDAERANLQLWSDNGTDAQRFVAVKNDDGYWKFAACCSGRVLDVDSGRAGDFTNVRQYTDNGTAAQEWSIRDNGDGSFTLVSRLSGFALDVDGGWTADGTNVQIYTDNGKENQKFMAEKVGTAPITPGWYTLTSALDSSKCLDLAADALNDGTRIQLYDRNGTAAQKFYLACMDGTYRLMMGDSYAVDVRAAGRTDGTAVQLYTRNHTDAQRWIIESNSDGTVSLRSACSGLYMDVQWAKTENGTPVQCWTGNGTAAQKWQLTAAE